MLIYIIDSKLTGDSYINTSSQTFMQVQKTYKYPSTFEDIYVSTIEDIYSSTIENINAYAEIIYVSRIENIYAIQKTFIQVPRYA